MSNETPLPVLRYLKSIWYQGSNFAYLQLDQNNYLVECGGALVQFGLPKIDPLIPIDDQIPQLSGLLPANGKPVVIANTHIDEIHYTDLHIYRAIDSQWVLFLDSTAAGNAIQSAQQRRLSKERYS